MESKLVSMSKEYIQKSPDTVHFVDNQNQNKLLNDLDHYPHAFVLACIMDKQITAERAWAIPYKVYEELGNFNIDFLAKVELKEYKELFNKGSYHRFNNDSAKYFYKAILKIKNDYGGDASKIWSNNPSSASVVSRFLEFEGSGPKIATMAANILARQFKIPMSDYYSIDISTDVHIKRVMERLGYLKEKATNTQIIYKAREICPEYPGIIDHTCWDIGRTYCHPKNPNCISCPLNIECKYYIDLNDD